MKAIVIGATGAVGKDLVLQLLDNENFSEVKIFVRRNLDLENQKLTQHIINFDKSEAWQDWVQGDVLFSTMGTTLKQAKSKENQWKIDHDYPLQFAKIAQKNGVKQQVLVSSASANVRSPFFYMKMKGKLEEAMKTIGFERLIILRPPALIRKNSDRAGENLAVKIIQFFNKLGLFKSMKPMPTEFLAQRMINFALQSEKGIFIKEPTEIWVGSSATRTGNNF